MSSNSNKCRLCQKVNPPGSRFCNYCGNDLNLSIQPDGFLPPGAVLRGSYVVENVIGEGGMGVVYSCHHKTLGTRYALKVLDSKLARMDILRQRFLAEAKIQATVRHPHIVHVMDVIDSDKDGGIPGILAIVMEYVKGEALDQILKDGPLSERDAVSCALVILDAIGFAHHANIVHRDLKPQNIMISSSEAAEGLYHGVKVMDFGIAKVLQDREHRTLTGAQMGTPRYMAPEQIENAGQVDERADLYAIGLTLYEMLCNRTPFEEYREYELIKAQLSMKPPSMRNFRSDISERLEAIVMKSLEKDRENRYPNAESFQRALLSLGGYDDITLMLNPFDGTTGLATSQKLQKKIQRAIKKTESSDEAKSPGKAKATLDVSAQAAVAQAVAASVEKALEKPVSDEKNKSVKAEARADKSIAKASVDSAGAKKTEENVDAQDVVRRTVQAVKKEAEKTGTQKPVAQKTGTQKSVPQSTRSKSHPSIFNLAKEKQEKSDGKTPSKVFKLNEKSLKLARAASKPGLSKAETKSSADNGEEIKVSQVLPENGEQEVVKKEASTQTTSVRRKAKSSEGEPSVSRQTSKEGNSSSKAVVNTPKASDNGLKKVPKKDRGGIEETGTRNGKGVKIAVVILVLLIVLGIVYRQMKDAPVPLQPSAENENTDVVEDNKDAARVEEIDLSTATVREIESETGRMTVLPKGRHWVSTQKHDELRQVELGAFAIDQVEVSYYQYQKCVEAGKCPPVEPAVDLNLPVTGVGYGTAQMFCEFVGKELPTEDEWEAAARFGGTTNGITDVNVTCENILFGSGSECKKKNPSSAESVFRRVQSNNPGHLMNMLGNVREWTTTADKKDPQKYVVKGGSYRSERSEINISATKYVGVNKGEEDVGFRCVKHLTK